MPLTHILVDFAAAKAAPAKTEKAAGPAVAKGSDLTAIVESLRKSPNNRPASVKTLGT